MTTTMVMTMMMIAVMKMMTMTMMKTMQRIMMMMQSTGPQGSSSTVPGVKVDPGAQGLLHRRQGQHHPHHLYHCQHQLELCHLYHWHQLQ